MSGSEEPRGVREPEAAFEAAPELSADDPRAEQLARERGMPEDLIAQIKEGLQAVREGRVVPQEEVFAAIRAKHGW